MGYSANAANRSAENKSTSNGANDAVQEHDARGGTRTRTGLLPWHFKCQASARFATRAVATFLLRALRANPKPELPAGLSGNVCSFKPAPLTRFATRARA
jgi:hypothetical protein